MSDGKPPLSHTILAGVVAASVGTLAPEVYKDLKVVVKNLWDRAKEKRNQKKSLAPEKEIPEETQGPGAPRGRRTLEDMMEKHHPKNNP